MNPTMKKVIYLLFFVTELICAACGSSANKNAAQNSAETTAPQIEATTSDIEITEIDPVGVYEIMTAQQLGKAYDGEDDEEDEDGYDSPQDCYPISNISSTSRLATQGNVNYDEKNLYDEDYQTSWAEGVDGYGIGEKITFEFNDVNAGFTGIEIANGDYASEDAWRNYSRVKKLKLSFNGEPIFILNLKDEMGNQVFSWDKELNVKDEELLRSFTVTLEIMDVYKGDLYDNTVISEVLPSGCY